MSDKILRAYIESYKGVVDTEIDFEQNNILAVIGDGGTGKTSIIEFFKTIVTATVPEHHINIGRGRAAGGVDLQINGKVYKVKFTRTKKSETVSVVSPDNMRGGKEVLRELVGAVAIDPFYLQGLDLKDQIREFKKLMRIDTKDFDKRIKEAEGEREVIGRMVRNLDGSIKNDPNNRIDFEQHKAKYAKEKEMNTRQEDLKEYIKHNQEHARKTEKVKSLELRTETINDDILAIDRQIEELLKQKQKMQDTQVAIAHDLDATSEWLAENPPKDTDALQAEIDEIHEFNRERSSLLAFFDKKEEYAKKLQEYNDQKALVTKMVAEKQEYIKNNLVQIPGFEFLEPKYDDQGQLVDDREGPYYNGVPLSGLSTTELVTFAIEFKKSLVGGLPVVIVDDLESVGSKGRAALAQMCHEGKCQAIVSIMDAKVNDLKIVLKNDLNISDSDIANATNGHEEYKRRQKKDEDDSEQSLKDFENQSKE